jgi:Zn-dependent M28 family amino/carboxypeptidase
MDAATLTARGEAGDFPPSFQLRHPITVRVPLAFTAHERPYNVVAMVEGSDPTLKHQYVTIASHLDGAVGDREVAGDRIYNSADDNATGSAATLSIAEQLMKAPRPKRSVIFVWDSGEERGLWGTRHFVHRPPVPLDRIVAHANVDMIGATRAPGTADADSSDAAGPNAVFLIGPGVLSPATDALLQRVNAEYLRMTLDRRDDRADSEFFYPRTDAGPYLERGILTINFNTGTHPRYHQPSDEARYLDSAKMHAVTRTVFASVWALANTDARPRIERPLPPSVLRP